MFKKDFIIPALLGLGLYAENCDMKLGNNTTMLLLLLVVLEDHAAVEELRHRIYCLERHNDRNHHQICECFFCNERDGNRRFDRDHCCIDRNRRFH